MTGKTHAITSGVIGAFVTFKFELHPIHILICIIGGLFPDADHRKSYVGRILPLWLFCKPHRRNILHSLIGAIAFSIPLLTPSYMFLFFIGYISHLLLDVLNATGVRLWWPSNKMVSVASIKVGGIGELLVMFIFYMMILALMSYW